MLRRGGADGAIDEYNNPSGAATAGHIHAQFAARGGVFDGPDSGYPAVLHGSEMVAPVDMNSVLMKLARTPADSTAVGQTSPVSSSQNSKSGSKSDDQALMNLELYGMVSTKIDRMLSVLENSHDTQSSMLTHAKM
jgi:hypothetical protein